MCRWMRVGHGTMYNTDLASHKANSFIVLFNVRESVGNKVLMC